MDSWLIVHELEKQYPSPSLHLDDPIVVRIRDHVGSLMKPLQPHLIPKVPVVFLNKVSADYFYETRKKRFGMPLPDLEKNHATEECWELAKAPAKEAGDLLRRHGGPFFLGETGKQQTGYIVFVRCMLIQCSFVCGFHLCWNDGVDQAPRKWLVRAAFSP